MEKPIPVIGLAGYSGSGKTTFLEKLITELKRRGYRLGVIKHTHHKDTRRPNPAGAAVEVLAAPDGAFMFREFETEPPPEKVISMLDGVDLILIEGYKQGRWPKLAIFRHGVTERPAIDPEDLLAEISDVSSGSAAPHFSLDDAAGVADLLERVILKMKKNLRANIPVKQKWVRIHARQDP
ncbi:Molybdopterin-guanine dinucleotide biosynthesis adapter protein [Pelotomaculum schinkii]|uniref:Molybdopterin-guanine dinucleotide biosynthesis adapter protein n=1 Tax=Pelotomaculum schinkii TaxID=78350 RepID=A0A4Y7RH69_9FIRM|nr:molybdopterin-guanine dinucleotide biosynthesis protein B [Pelotomaculum schinkii]TEB08109.1 Molybdopterin-guanine dinucleotide biosynthesis adapter protein [Pelotomaculum schinkii]